MPEITLDSLKKLWKTDKEKYRTEELGSGVQRFCKEVLSCPNLFNLVEGNAATNELNRKNEFLHEKKKRQRRADFVIFIDSDIIIPVEVECFGNIKAGVKQLANYQVDWVKKFGILTDGYEWRFYINKYPERKFFIDKILDDPTTFLTFWKEYITPEHYYSTYFLRKENTLFEPNVPHLDDVREDFFRDITKLIDTIKNKLNLKGYFAELKKGPEIEVKAIEITYAYLIQFILYKTLVDNAFCDFEEDWKLRLDSINNALKSHSYGEALSKIQGISNKISENIYKPFNSEQKNINIHIADVLKKPKNEINDVSVWLDIILFIYRYNFSNVKNEIFGYVYENYLKDLYSDENKGQYFTDPDVVDFMLEEIGFNQKDLTKRQTSNGLSLIDPSCGSGTFLYNATHRIVEAFFDGTPGSSLKVEKLINENIFGLDIAEFPLYLAEMNIIMRMLPIIMNQKYNNPIDQKIKVFKTNDSIAEFIPTGLQNTIVDITSGRTQLSLTFSEIELPYESFVRDKKDLIALKNSLGGGNIPRLRFDFVIGNPPYIGYNVCSKQKLLIFNYIKQRIVLLKDIYGVNLHSVTDDRKVNRPNPNLYLFFIALGIALLKNNGKLCYIIPQTLLTAGDFNVMRYHLAKYVTIEKMIIFKNAMFIGRGIKQRKKIATSSLILVLSKKTPTDESIVTIVKHNNIKEEIKLVISEIHENKNITKTKVLQKDLLANYQNWNYILFDDQHSELYKDYKKNPSISIYSEHKQARLHFNSLFFFDGGYSIDERKRLDNPPSGDYYIYPKFDNHYYTKIYPIGFWPNERERGKHIIKLRQASQGYNLLDCPYKIVWSYQNPARFFFTDEKVIWARNQYNAIGSNNKTELLYLFALLNSKLNWLIIKKNVSSANEKGVLFSLKGIKKFVKVPEHNSKNFALKQEIISQTSSMLDLEKLKINDVVDFKGVLLQKFDFVEVRGNKLFMSYKTNQVHCQIHDNPALIQQIIMSSVPMITSAEGVFELSIFKSLPVVDFERQMLIKNYIDDLIFALYFGIQIDQPYFSKASDIQEILLDTDHYKIVNSN